MSNQKSKGECSIMQQRLAHESQLIAEERWLVNALKKISQQRNSLQVRIFLIIL